MEIETKSTEKKSLLSTLNKIEITLTVIATTLALIYRNEPLTFPLYALLLGTWCAILTFLRAKQKLYLALFAIFFLYQSIKELLSYFSFI
ncbi:MAG: hypothetical protein FJZ56_04485 [Chlamydiae bacterium]|nr:hypothetical protein [Chlamydiota bacterium]